ncbi:peroxisomal leader peptide-processing protease [Protopterus annectens]|uniref:peroxisomal leader peptide-processing protease n=1 Tax=Protopterus annectens TaxID=7888 RepID=UPI001CFB0534|nr:peroxisomal leader peptide-processing protease [Protopterus annectens]
MSLENSGCIVTVNSIPQAICYHETPKFSAAIGAEWSSKSESTSPKLTLNDPGTKGQLSCSGVILDPDTGLVLCHGMIFLPFLLDRDLSKCHYLFRDSFTTELQLHVNYLTTKATTKKEVPYMYHGEKEVKLNRRGLGMALLSSTHQIHRKIETVTAELLLMVSCSEFQDSFTKLFRKSDSWHFYTEQNEGDADTHLNDMASLHWFTLLKMQNFYKSGMKRLNYASAGSLKKGDVTFACGSPFSSFCPDIFMNTLSKGIVSNLDGKRNAMILTDARCLPGTEGGGVFILSAGQYYLCGIIVAPLCWRANEWIGLTLVCSVAHIIENVKQALPALGCCLNSFLVPISGSRTHFMKFVGNSGLFHLLSAVVLIESDRTWGSGVMLNPKLLLTCRHVMDGAVHITVKLAGEYESSGLNTIKGKVVFATEEASPYDIAVAELESPVPGIKEPILANAFHSGEDLLVIGYGVFGRLCSPSVTSGILSSVITVDGKPVMLQTTCAVHSGSSGGALISACSGELLGIVSSNTKDNTVGATYPHLNFSIPVTVLQSPLTEYTKTRDTTAFEVLNRAGEEVKAVWKLQRKSVMKPSSKL